MATKSIEQQEKDEFTEKIQETQEEEAEKPNAVKYATFIDAIEGARAAVKIQEEQILAQIQAEREEQNEFIKKLKKEIGYADLNRKTYIYLRSNLRKYLETTLLTPEQNNIEDIQNIQKDTQSQIVSGFDRITHNRMYKSFSEIFSMEEQIALINKLGFCYEKQQDVLSSVLGREAGVESVFPEEIVFNKIHISAPPRIIRPNDNIPKTLMLKKIWLINYFKQILFLYKKNNETSKTNSETSSSDDDIDKFLEVTLFCGEFNYSKLPVVNYIKPNISKPHTVRSRPWSGVFWPWTRKVAPVSSGGKMKYKNCSKKKKRRCKARKTNKYQRSRMS